jgi:saccharopine dehydrogenase-like NADP-dependent oxidoreductase
LKDDLYFLLKDFWQSNGDSPIDSLSKILEDKLRYEKSERDLVCLHHQFEIITKEGREEKHESSLLAYGDPNGFSAMAKTVGLPAAIASDLILKGVIEEKGVVIPTSKAIYTNVLEELERRGIKFKENRIQ